jgi:hypothetical protein
VNDKGAGLKEDHRVNNNGIYCLQLMEKALWEDKEKVRAGSDGQ